ncbi:hypothetical protein ES705_40043 [subsurface metagenome]
MDDKRIVSARIDENLYSEIREAASEADMSLSEWITDRITDTDTVSDSPTADNILNMDWNEKIAVADEYGLDADPENYNNDDEFAEAIIDDLGLEYPLDENPGNLTWLLAVPVLGFFVWLLVRKPDQPA